MIKSQENELQQGSVQSQNPYVQSKMIAKDHGIKEAVGSKPCSLPNLDPNVVINLKYKDLELKTCFLCCYLLTYWYSLTSFTCRFMKKGMGEVK